MATLAADVLRQPVFHQPVIRQAPALGAAPSPVAEPASARPSPMAETGIAYDRLMLLLLLFAAATALIGGRLTLLHLFSPAGASPGAASVMLPPRGDIVDRNGLVLARTIEAWAIGVRPTSVIGDRTEIAAQLNELMPERSAEEYLRILNARLPFTYLARRAEPELVQAVNALGEPGIVFQRELERLYPQAALGAHVLGWVGPDGRGAAGIERALDAQLVAEQGRGQPIALSIDSRVQAAMEEELGSAMRLLRAEGGSGIVLDVDTGEVVALASAPFFNPNVPREATADGLRNNAIQGVYELGSTFKPLTVAAALEARVARPSQRWDADTPLQIGRHSIRDSHPMNRWITVPEVLVHSSNIATARIADRMGADRMQAMFRQFRFHERMPFELRERAAPLYPRGEWARATLLTTSFGHGMAVTPLHLASAYATLVNGGVWRPATLLHRSGQAPAGERVFSVETSHRMRQMLRLIVTEGTGGNADAPGFRVGGKTGTAEKVSASGGYSRSVNVSTFVAAFPMDAPRYVVLVMLDAPRATAATSGQTTAGWTAAPVVRNVIARTGALLGVIPDERRDIDLGGMTELVRGARDD